MKILGQGISTGSSLLEVLIALSLMALVMLGTSASQLGLAASERRLTQREHAMLIAASVAEAARDSAFVAAALERWRDRAARLLPGAEIAVLNQPEGVALAVVQWRSPLSSTRSARSELIPVGASSTTSAACSTVVVRAGMSCEAMAFAYSHE